jgi:hypothetical protein
MMNTKKKTWQKPEIRRLNLSPEERDRLFPELRTTPKVAAIGR